MNPAGYSRQSLKKKKSKYGPAESFWWREANKSPAATENPPSSGVATRHAGALSASDRLYFSCRLPGRNCGQGVSALMQTGGRIAHRGGRKVNREGVQHHTRHREIATNRSLVIPLENRAHKHKC